MFRRYLLPALVFQSIIIAGGYGTGRELVEFFLRFGPVGGLYGLLGPTLIVVTLCCMIGFELARRFQAYDYRSFFQELLGPLWVLFEITYLILVLLVMAVLGSAAGSFLVETFSLPYAVGVAGLFLAIALLTFLGSGAIEQFLSFWSLVLYGVYFAFFGWTILNFADPTLAALADGEVRPGWFGSGIRYAAGTVGLLPAMLFATRHIETRRQALWAGFLAGPISLFPAVLFYVAMLGQYPAIVERPVPANYLLEVLGSRGFQIFFQVMLFGTLIETGSGLIHAFNERIAGSLEVKGRSLPDWVRPGIALVLLVLAAGLSRFGIIELIGKGYNAITWALLLLVIVPILTIGLVKVIRPLPVPD